MHPELDRGRVTAYPQAPGTSYWYDAVPQREVW